MHTLIELLTTKEVAEILQVSSSTVRRLSDKNTIKSYIVNQSNYRKYCKNSVIEYKEKLFANANASIKAETIKNNITNISAKSHPKHYLMHKYWGRKAHNVISDYIKYFSKNDEIILDPFMGSGVTIIESLKLNKKVIGIDINPMSLFIVKNTINKVNLNKFKKAYLKIYQCTFDLYNHLYRTTCPLCKKYSYIETAVWEDNELLRIRGKCEEHNLFIKDASNKDLDMYKKCTFEKEKLIKENKIKFPTDEIMKYVKRSGRERIDELFSDRALVILSFLLKEINKVDEINIKNLLLFCFTSMLSNVSRMLPGDLKMCTYKSGWVISKFWTPQIHTERNIFKCLDLRFKAIINGKKEIENLNPELANLILGDSSKLKDIDDESIGYIFTDPPYGESIAYLALSQFWNSWITSDVDYINEIIIDPYRKKDYKDYENRMNMVFKELYRVLKYDRYLSFSFHNRDLNVWKAILNSCLNSGFTLESVVLQEQAVSSGTQGINKKNTLTGDFIYNFKKIKQVNNEINKIKNPVEFIKNEIHMFIKDNDGATPTELYEFLIPKIVMNNSYTDENGNIINIDKILKENFEYIENLDKRNKLGNSHKWIIKSK
ncbi:DNA methyltransferase [Aliarcobacter cryaerophilus]|uniref:helix-turn-helix domain-containing protein n=1 Tax=Aliarcobacter cryaerophilus TaxID=28198 RepID=UPI0021B3E96E|nr:helix-turn-helix domain-containing protein [Aliarcobacter cryaerophilus]MCT7464886.1 DNA methyltransferase [Aliarcobacter cryaerophilus]